MAGAPAGPPQNLLVWNPHWQCFVWNQNDCAENVVEALNTFLVAFDVDFAAVIELAAPGYQSPSGWDFMVGKCGHDLVHLFYNRMRWEPSGANVTGCMQPAPLDRPFVVQHFVSPEGEKVIATAAHFPHPTFTEDLGVYRQTAQTSELKRALEEVRQATGTEKVVLMADTNAWSWVSNDMIWHDQLALPGTLVSTDLMQTCCADAGFPPAFTFDRIMANFGSSMSSTALYGGDLPNWTIQVKGQKIGAFHRPVVARVQLTSAGGGLSGVWIAMWLLLFSTLVLAGVLAALLFRRWRRRRDEEYTTSSSGEEESMT
ncbi:unnamed protein product [Effrenium voratum]|uniref:Endonuclease/exonuclease/phosphatase domain-containing protein n=1 Tax=Effrenium voratum TaxID=2562239 RepID=A0AA36NAE8_9DINO|nr:unnamed protein product [Effrenium voratum]CAJ1434002.1 unnamed protein product [Effrenium voratum]